LTGLTRSLSLDGREFDIACGQIDIGNAATTRNEDTARGRLQASNRVEAEARIDVNDVARGVAYMASLSLEANVQFMTVMATKCPMSVVADASQHCMSSMLTPSGAAT
jgi:NADP-dependent 3-hydroxy acid dehydrogenase YdfG